MRRPRDAAERGDPGERLMSFSRRRLTILAGAGCLTLILVTVTVLRREVVMQYHLLRLRSDPGYLQTYIPHI